MRTTFLILLTAVAACGDDTTPARPDLAMSGGDLSSTPDLGTGPDQGSSTVAIVTTSDFTPGGVGSLDTVALPDDSVTKDIDKTLDQDNEVRASAGYVFVLDHTHSTMRIYDPKKMWMSPVEVMLPGNSNPRDVAVAGGKAYVSLNAGMSATAIAVVDLGQGKQTGSIAVPTVQADTDGIPEVADVWSCGGLLYFGVQDLDESKGFAPLGPGRIAVVDPTMDMVTRKIQLAGANPNGFAQDGADCHVVLVADSANLFGAVDGTGGIERVDLGKGTSALAIPDQTLGGHPSTIAEADPGRAYTVLAAANGGTQTVLQFDPVGKTTKTLSPPAGFIRFAQVSPDGTQLFVAVDFPDSMTNLPAPGLYVAKTDGSMLPQAPIDLGLAPYSAAFITSP